MGEGITGVGNRTLAEDGLKTASSLSKVVALCSEGAGEAGGACCCCCSSGFPSFNT